MKLTESEMIIKFILSKLSIGFVRGIDLLEKELEQYLENNKGKKNG